MPNNEARLPAGLRLYAIGDIHGSLEQLKELLKKVYEDRTSFAGTTRIIFLGDYIDRGLYSKQTIDFLIDLQKHEKDLPIFIMGNHEQVMRSLLRDSDQQLLLNWFSFGGRETLLSYGINPSLAIGNPAALFKAMEEKVPKAHVNFFDNLELSVSFGDYFFCHAGVKPNIDLNKQNEQDLTWIRYEFLNHKDSFGKMVVHGHTISHDVQFMPNRIGIDTGAYATGCLTALALEDTKQWLIQTG